MMLCLFISLKKDTNIETVDKNFLRGFEEKHSKKVHFEKTSFKAQYFGIGGDKKHEAEYLCCFQRERDYGQKLGSKQR